MNTLILNDPSSCCNSTYRLRYWNHIDVNIVEAKSFKCVATVLTVYGIETTATYEATGPVIELQQYLPFTVLKLGLKETNKVKDQLRVATVLTVYGIETETSEVNPPAKSYKLQQYLPFTVLKRKLQKLTLQRNLTSCNSTYRLRYWNRSWRKRWITWA